MIPVSGMRPNSENVGTGMKIRNAVVWPKHWTTPLGNETDHAPVDNGILTDIRGWEDTSNIILIVRCPAGNYYGAISTHPQRYQSVVQALNRNKKRRLREIKEAEIDVLEPVS
jgi:hypothetical protein